MGKIFCLMGKSGSGKDSVFRALMKEKSLGLFPYVPYTTRPRRQGETDGVEYHFITQEELSRFRSGGKVIEQRRYETRQGPWYYCTVDDGSFLPDRSVLLITTLEAFGRLKAHFGEKAVFPLYLNVEDGVRLQRALNRERRQRVPDYAELCRRFLADSADFSAENLQKNGIRRRYENLRFAECVGRIRHDIRNITKKDGTGC